MTSFNLLEERRILIFELRNYRKEYIYNEVYIGHGEYYDQRELKWFNSYAIYNGETGSYKIVNVDNLKTSTFDYLRMAYVLEPDEQALVMKGHDCFHMNKDGELLDKLEKGSFYHYQVNEINKPLSQSEDEDENCEDLTTDNQRINTIDYKIDNHSIIHKDGTIIQSDLIFLEIIENVIICYRETESESGCKKRIYGICDSFGNLLGELKYDYIRSNEIIRNKYISVESDNKYGLIDFNGNEIVKPISDDYIYDCDGNIAIINNEHELINVNTMATLFTTEYHILRIVNGWMRVVTDCLYYNFIGLLDSQGRLHKFYELPHTAAERQKYRSLEDMPKIPYVSVGSFFSDGLLPVRSSKRGFGYVNLDGKEVIDCKYTEISDFKNGKAKVRFDCLYCYIDCDGCVIVNQDGKEITLPKKYDWASDFLGDFAIVQKGKSFGAIDRFKNVIIPCSLDSIETVLRVINRVGILGKSLSYEDYIDQYYNNEKPIRFEENKRYGFKRPDGKVLCPPVLSVGDFHEGRASIGINGRVGYLNEKLELVIEAKFQHADNFSEGLALIYDGDYAYINRMGVSVLECGRDYENLGPFKGGVVECERNYHLSRHENEYCKLTKYSIGYLITF